MIVGLTGGIGSGKSAAATMFTDLGIPIIDADVIARDLVNKDPLVLERIADQFGQALVHNGQLNRAALRTIIFADKQAKQWLEQLLHPLVRQAINQQLHEYTQSQLAYVILCSPLLFETEQDQLTDTVIVVDVSEQTQIERTLARDGSDLVTIKAILASQWSRQARLNKANFTLNNEGSLAELEQQIKQLHSKLMTKASVDTV